MRNRTRGFTLAEILVSLGIVAFLVIALFLVLSRGREDYYMLQTNTQLYANARRGLEEIVRRIRESNIDTVTIGAFTDPIDGAARQILIFASARDAAGGFNIAANGLPQWQAVEVVSHYVTGDNIDQLKRYTDYSSIDYSASGVFPFSSSISATASGITILSGDGQAVTLPREGGRVMANYVESEQFGLSGGAVSITLSLRKEASRIKGGGRVLSATLQTAAQARNK